MISRSTTNIAFTTLLGAVLTASAFASIPTPIHSPSPVPLDKIRVNNPSVLSLTGRWKFQLTRGVIGRAGFVAGSHGPVTASSAQEGHAAEFALAEPAAGKDLRWCASSEEMPQWWQADLGTASQVTGLDLAWEFADAKYSYRVEASADAKSWVRIVDRSAAPGDAAAPNFQPIKARYLKVTVTKASRGSGPAWACIRHIAIHLSQNGSSVIWKAPPAAEEPVSQRDRFAGTATSDATWSTMPVPGNWEMEGFSKPTYDGPDNAVGLYRRWIDVPASFSHQHIVWHFEGVWDGAELFVNGKPAGYHESGFTAFDMDVTGLVKPGERNLLAVRVSKTTPSDDLDTGDYWSLGGIYRDTYLVAVNPTHVSDITVLTDFDAHFQNSKLSVGLKTAAAGGAKLTADAALFDANGARIGGVSFQSAVMTQGVGSRYLQLQSDVKNVKLWSAEKPNLYYVVVTLSADGKVVERVQERFGFRKVEIKNGVVLWNGQPIKCTGTCRHEEWAALGHALTESAWRTDLKLMKGCNINAVRTSHYNHAGRFLELCDEAGIYVLDEVPACWCNLSDLTLTSAFVQRTRETLDRDKNKPCVLAWSLANESGYGPNAAAMLDYVKANDPTRPAFVSQCGPWNNPKIDFQDTHYPSIEEVKRMAAEPLRMKTPLVMTEQPHIFYVGDGLAYDYGEKDFWGEVLASNWSVVWPTPSILGSFIWEWQDQGIADKYPDNGRDRSGLRGNNVKGIVDGYRNPKPEYWNIKMVYSPVIVTTREAAIEGSKCSIPVENRYAFTDLSELTCRWQNLSGEMVVASGTCVISGAPGAHVLASIPASAGADTVRLEFVHPDGRMIYAARVHIQGAAAGPSAPMAAGSGTVRIQNETDAFIKVTSGDSVLTFSKSTGQMESWKYRETDLIAGPLALNLGEHRANHGDHGARDFIESQTAPRIENAFVETNFEGGTEQIRVTGQVYLTNPSDRLAKLITTYTLLPAGELKVHWELRWAAAAANCWELGMTLPLPHSLDRLAWFREGLWTEYPKDHIGVTTGLARPADLTFRCSKRDVHWASLTNANGIGLCALKGDGPLHTRANAANGGITLYLSSAIAPPYDFSTNLLPDKLIRLRQGEAVTGEFVLRPVSGR